jgi:hypothetical protein
MCGMAAIAFRRDGLALAAFSHQQIRLRMPEPAWAAHVALRPPLRLLPSSVELPTRCAQDFVECGYRTTANHGHFHQSMDCLRYQARNAMPSMGTPIQGLVTEVTITVLGTAVNMYSLHTLHCRHLIIVPRCR